jgi:hypothetical protein
MSYELELLTSTDTFHDLHLLADGKDGKCRVEKKALRELLIDHTGMIQALQRHSYRIRYEPPPRKRERIL